MQKYMVIGAGILGASTAYHLAKKGADVTIIDRNDRGQATEAAAGIVCPWLSQRRNKKWYRLVKGGARYYPELIEMLKEDGERETGYSRVGAISLHTDEKKLDQMVERAFKRREDAPEIGEITRLSPEETKEKFPLLAEEYGSVHVSGAARVDGRALKAALLNAAQKNGATFIQGDASLIYQEGKVTGVKVNGETIDGKVLVTAGVWAKSLLDPIGVEFLVSSQKAQIVHLDMPNTDTSQWPVVMPPNNQYMLSFDGGRIVAGATHEDDVGFDQRPTAGGMHYIFDKALEVAPGLYDSTLVETRVGFRPFTPGFLPVFGPVPNIDGLLVANGLGASGLTSGPYLGAELAKLALGATTELDPAEYDVAEAVRSE
ncbi:FAD-binding oxidoreductase [Halobacillus sp. BBL2006]|uniref:NAD(P)/FAD-dependent oxidoreductase n=1 Tax=Halobacillus sp. BBL2006 TaxID=1543706 RepID=UPI0005433E2B|nr:FAD-dependent oxidoreductase [Halobacillus sp. BBL2006]KHE72596.1 oxidoreductase [Halobacillus sp. BBL2006]